MTQPPSDRPPPADAGVVARVRTRTVLASAAAIAAGVVLAALGWWRPGWFAGVGGDVIGGCVVALCAAWGITLAARAAAWARAARLLQGFAAAPAGGWARIAVGVPVPIHHRRRGSPPIRVGRRLQAHVLPLRAAAGPLAAGRAVILHPREDGLLPQPGDDVQIHEIGRHGPFLIRRADGVVFVADSWTLSTV